MKKQREYKFRAWNKKRKKWIYFNEGLDHTAFVGGILLPIKNVVINQCTGLKDKNGKEIYEGDILEEKSFDYNHRHTANCFDKKSNEICDPYWSTLYVVKFGKFEYSHYEGYGVYAVGAGSESSPKLIDNKNRVIIGNIYENPNLLK